MAAFTHQVLSSGQLCFPAPWWPTTDKSLIEREKSHPMMTLKSGQVTRIKHDNLRPLVKVVKAEVGA